MKFPFKEITDCVEETEKLGMALADILAEDVSLPRFVAMYGDLGVGKTAFVRGFCSKICRGSTVKSPTFALVNEYKCLQDVCEVKRVYHFDMYRITDEDDLYSIGYYDYLRPDSICIAEWCEIIPYALPEYFVKVEINKEGLGDKRSIVISLVGENI